MLKASFQKYRLHFKEPSGTSRGILLDKDTYFIRIWEEGAETCFGLGECALFRGLSAEDRPDYEEKLREVCNRIAEIEIASLQEWSSIRFGVEMAFADLRQGGKRIYFPSASVFRGFLTFCFFCRRSRDRNQRTHLDGRPGNDVATNPG